MEALWKCVSSHSALTCVACVPDNHQGAEETNTTSEKMPEVVQKGSKQAEVKEKQDLNACMNSGKHFSKYLPSEFYLTDS